MANNYITISDAAARGPLSATSLQKMRAAGTLPCVVIGRKTLVNYPALIMYLDHLPAGADIYQHYDTANRA